MTDVLTVIGARPQFVKASVVSTALCERGLQEQIVHTGQHYDQNMSAVFFDELGIRPPDVNLGVGHRSHARMTADMLVGIEAEIQRSAPRVVLVYGDTNSTLAAAFAAAKLRVPVAHVEAGLRSRNRSMPEEINRVATDHVSDLLLTPTDAATANLEAEGLSDRHIAQVGDVMYDVAIRFGSLAADRASTVLDRLDVASGTYVLATVHRAENTDDPVRFRAVLEGLGEVAREQPVVLPLHPRSRAVMDELGIDAEGLRLIDPVGYLDMTALEMHASTICTDSGGLQKEAFFHRVPCVTFRNETEWTELIDLGWNRLVPPRSAATVAAGVHAADRPDGEVISPYGDGAAAPKVAVEISRLLVDSV